MGIQDVVRWFLPREDHFYDYLEKQAVVAHEGAQAMLEFARGVASLKVRERVQELEHKGDELFHGLEAALARTFVTPIDREDLQKLSSELDDVLDLINGAIRAADLYGLDAPTEPMRRQMDILVSCTQTLMEAMPLLRRHAYDQLREVVRAVRACEKDGDAVYREAVSQLFKAADVDAKRLLREREVLEDLENAIDYCDRLAGTLTNLAVKHG
jgi:uncharacterized protein Yka (UPF0111/DUF47 family)